MRGHGRFLTERSYLAKHSAGIHSFSPVIVISFNNFKLNVLG